MRRIWVYVLASSIFISLITGCTGPGQSVGALLGAGIGALAGGNVKSAAVGGLLGAAVGSVVDLSKNNAAGQPQPGTVVEAYQPPLEGGYAVVPPIIGGSGYYDPPIVVAHEYDHRFTYEEVGGGYVNIVTWRNGRRFRSEIWRDEHGQRMTVGRMHEWGRSQKIRNSELTHHRELLEHKNNSSYPDSYSGLKRQLRHNFVPSNSQRAIPTARPAPKPNGKQIFRPRQQLRPPQQKAPRNEQGRGKPNGRK